MTKNEAIELERLKFNVDYDNETLSYRAFGLVPSVNQELLQQAITILEGLKDKEEKNERGTETVSV